MLLFTPSVDFAASEILPSGTLVTGRLSGNGTGSPDAAAHGGTWDDTDSHVEDLIALTGDYRVARAAFDEAVRRRTGRIVTLRQKTRLLADKPAEELTAAIYCGKLTPAEED